MDEWMNGGFDGFACDIEPVVFQFKALVSFVI